MPDPAWPSRVLQEECRLAPRTSVRIVSPSNCTGSTGAGLGHGLVRRTSARSWLAGLVPGTRRGGAARCRRCPGQRCRPVTGPAARRGRRSAPGGLRSARTASSTPGMNEDAVQRVVPDGQRLALGAEDDLLVRDQAGDAQRVHPDAVHVGAARAVERLRRWRPARRRRPASARAAAISSAVRTAVPLGASALLRVVQLDDLGRLVDTARRAGRTSSTAPRRCRSSARSARRRPARRPASRAPCPAAPG